MKLLVKTVERMTGWVYNSRRRIATAGVVLLAGMVAFHVVFGANGVFVYSKKRAEYRDLDSELKSLKLDNERLNQNIKALRTDPKTIEKEAREQLRYTRPGEVVYALPTEKTAQTNSSTAQKR
ncbi:MAG TPA: septum formation initiator family protein [Terriglobales bacterium]|nr:septum formation initiator family protein [Terriglobales bacterium]